MAAALEQVNEILALLSEIKEMPLNRESCKYFLCVLFHFLILFFSLDFINIIEVLALCISTRSFITFRF